MAPFRTSYGPYRKQGFFSDQAYLKAVLAFLVIMLITSQLSIYLTRKTLYFQSDDFIRVWQLVGGVWDAIFGRGLKKAHSSSIIATVAIFTSYIYLLAWAGTFCSLGIALNDLVMKSGESTLHNPKELIAAPFMIVGFIAGLPALLMAFLIALFLIFGLVGFIFSFIC